MSTDGSTPQDFRFQIAPRNGRAERLVIAITGDEEIHRDLLNPDLDRDRRSFLRRLEEIANLPDGELSNLATDLVAAADEADDLLAQATATQGASSGGRRSQASLIVDIVVENDDIDLIHDVEDVAYATLNREDHRETWSLRRKGFRSGLAREFYLQHGKVPGSQALQDALNVIEGRARYDGEEHEVHVRFAHVGEAIYVDLCDPSWQVVEITSSDWNILTDAPVRFCRHRGMLSLPEPQHGGSLNQL